MCHTSFGENSTSVIFCTEFVHVCTFQTEHGGCKIPWPADGLLFPVIAPDACLCKGNREKHDHHYFFKNGERAPHVNMGTQKYVPPIRNCYFLFIPQKKS